MVATRSFLRVLRIAQRNFLVLVFVAFGIGAELARGDVVGTGYLHEGSLVAWGDNNEGQATVPAGDTYTQIAGGGFHSLAIRSDGSIVSWGLNSFGQISNTPTGSFTQIAAGDFHSIALRTNGTVAAWGYNPAGATTIAPGQYKAIGASGYTSFAIRADGSLYSTNINWPLPAGNDFAKISAGQVFLMSLRSTGTLEITGFPGDVPRMTAPGTFKAIGAGSAHALAIRTDGTLAAWGWNAFGQLNVPAGNNFRQVDGGYGHGLALTTAGTLAGWGLNYDYNNHYFGQAVVPAGDTYLQVQAGDFQSIAIKGRQAYANLLISNVSDLTTDDTLLQRLVNVGGDVTVSSSLDWIATRGRMNVGGSVYINPGNELNILWGDAGEPQTVNGQTFTLFASSLPAQGEFAAIHLPPLSSPYLAWDTSQLYNQGFIQVVPEPSYAALLLIAFAGMCARVPRLRSRIGCT